MHYFKEIEEDKFDAIILNFANPDMVGHSGMLEPTIKAIETVDECLGKIVDAIPCKRWSAIITADHGNSDEVITLEGTANDSTYDKSSTSYCTRKRMFDLREDGILADLAPTMLNLLRIRNNRPEMTGNH